MPYSLSALQLEHHGTPLLTDLKTTLHLEQDATRTGIFARVEATQSSSCLKFELGRISGLKRATLCHRYEPYWMKARAITSEREVPPETQFLLATLEGNAWLLLVPLIDEQLRFSLQGNEQGRLELFGETGDAFLPARGGRALFIAQGTEPFTLLERGAEAVNAALGEGRLRRDKAVPDFVDRFGWCTWDAFYQEVSGEKLREGLERFRDGGVSPRFVILDDGWQSAKLMDTGERRLTSFAANSKFPGGLASSIQLAKREFGVTTFLVWHAVSGYWGGVDSESLPGYGVVDQPRHFGQGIMAHHPTFNNDWWGALVGLVPEASIERFYRDYHRVLAGEGVDGIKVDSQALLEGLANGQGGRVRLARAYRRALEKSALEFFRGRLINCMSNNQESWYLAADSTLLRSSMDFLPNKPQSHGAHLYDNAQVSLWFGHFMLPDWDMFQSGHAWGAFHGAARAVSGGPVYVSDKPGAHNFELLRKLVVSDGSVLRCDQPGMPTLDCLCADPTRDDVLLKIWNRAGAAGVVGVFNCRSTEAYDDEKAIAGQVSAADVPGLGEGPFACFGHLNGALTVLEAKQSVCLELRHGEYEIFTLIAIERGVAIIGLADKFNGHGAVRDAAWLDDGTLKVRLRDGGIFVAYSRAPLTKVTLAEEELAAEYQANTGLVRVRVPAQGDTELRLHW